LETLLKGEKVRSSGSSQIGLAIFGAESPNALRQHPSPLIDNRDAVSSVNTNAYKSITGSTSHGRLAE